MRRHERIEQRLRAELSPVGLEIVDESHMHASGPGAETHFKVTIASEAFRGRSRVERHRVVNRCLADELASGLHALSVFALDPDEASAHVAFASPACLGGSKHDAPKASSEIGDVRSAPRWT